MGQEAAWVAWFVWVYVCLVSSSLPLSPMEPLKHIPLYGLYMQGLRFKKAMLNLRSSKSFVLYSKHACFRLLRLCLQTLSPLQAIFKMLPAIPDCPSVPQACRNVRDPQKVVS